MSCLAPVSSALEDNIWIYIGIQALHNIIKQALLGCNDRLSSLLRLIAHKSPGTYNDYLKSIESTTMTVSTLEPPPDCGRRIIPKLIDGIAAREPQRPFISIPRSPSIEDGYEDIGYGTFANAVNSCSWWIEEHLGTSSGSQTIAYLGPLDVRYLIVLLAASKTGHVVQSLFHKRISI